MESHVPLGMWQATGEVASKAPTLAEIRRGSFGSNGWDGEGQRRNSAISESRRSLSRSSSAQSPTITSRGQETPVTVSTAKELFADIEEDQDDFPDIILGRGEMTDQCFVKGGRKLVRPPGADTDLDELAAQPIRSEKANHILGAHPLPSSSDHTTAAVGPDADGVYPNGYKFPAKHTWSEATVIGLKAFWKFTLTPLGFAIVLYGLNVVAWGGMLFLLLCGAAPRMCYPAKLQGIKDCNNIDAPRRIWIEIDSQILNALFCVTGFGLVPWRFRDLYYLLKYRIGKNHDALRKLAGIHRSWFRLPGSDRLPVGIGNADTDIQTQSNIDFASLPLPLSKTPEPPLTGVRAPPTAIWKLDYVIWAFVLNTFLQCVLSGFMWGLNRFDRPSWSTGTFVALACIVAALGGLMTFQEGKKVKKVEGIPVEVEKVVRDAEKAEEEKKGKTKVSE